MDKIIGIDIGTSNSAAAIMSNGKPAIIPSTEGLEAHGKMFPSVVSFTNGGRIVVGAAAKKLALINSDRAITAIKRKMGSDYQKKIDGRLYIPQEITAMILKKIKRDAEAHLGEKIKKAVITVPAYFNDKQRTATRDAALIAGLNVTRMINEPTAAALAYGLDKSKDDLKIAVLDLGGGTFDTTILEICNGVFRVLSTSGDTQLGGTDMDDRIVEYLLREIEREHGVDLRNNGRALQELRVAAEEAKIFLSTSLSAPINASLNTGDGSSLRVNTTLSRSKLEELIGNVVERLDKPMEQALADSKLEAKDLDRVILVGGPTNMPIVRRKFAGFFGREPEKDIDPMHCVAMGAAIQASVLTGEIKYLVLLDVTPLSLGIETSGSVFTKLIGRNTTIPTDASRVFTTAYDFQTVVPIHVLQGERTMAADNISLGVFNLTGIKLAPRHEPRIEVMFAIDANGILNISAEDLDMGKKQKIVVTEATKLPKSEIDRMIKEAGAFADTDLEKGEDIAIRNRARALMYEVDRALKNEKIAGNDEDILRKSIGELRNAFGGDDTVEIKKRVEELTGLVDKVAVKSRTCKRARALVSLTEKMIGGGGAELPANEMGEINEAVEGLKKALMNGDVREIGKRAEELTGTLAVIGDLNERGEKNG